MIQELKAEQQSNNQKMLPSTLYWPSNPYMDEELLTIMCNIFFGTTRDWWDMVRLETYTWRDFEHKFLSAFLLEDYMDKLEEWIRKRVQGEDESIWDFAYMYQALCCMMKTR